MRIVIDSNVFILGIAEIEEASALLLKNVLDLKVVVPRLIIQEVARNLKEIRYDLPKKFFNLIHSSRAFEIDERKIPQRLIRKYQR